MKKYEYEKKHKSILTTTAAHRNTSMERLVCLRDILVEYMTVCSDAVLS